MQDITKTIKNGNSIAKSFENSNLFDNLTIK
jgi:type II secretory pathway component PulF